MQAVAQFPYQWRWHAVGICMDMRYAFVLALVCFRVALTAQEPGAPKWIVPPVVEHKFNIENPEASARWKKDGATYSAQFINPLNNLGSIIVYDTVGKVVRRDRELENNEYPSPINDYFIRKYPNEGYAIWSSTDSAGNQNYFTVKNDRVIRFDKDGRLVSPVNLKPGRDSLTVDSVR